MNRIADKPTPQRSEAFSGCGLPYRRAGWLRVDFRGWDEQGLGQRRAPRPFDALGAPGPESKGEPIAPAQLGHGPIEITGRIKIRNGRLRAVYGEDGAKRGGSDAGKMGLNWLGSYFLRKSLTDSGLHKISRISHLMVLR
jgi:hypothetical protein